MRRIWLLTALLVFLVAALLSGCRSAPSEPSAASIPKVSVPAGPLCEAQGPPIERVGSAEGWSFCVQQESDCNLANAAQAVRLRWCDQSPAQKCVDTGCKKYRGGVCSFGIAAPSGVELRATPPRNPLCGGRWECKVRTERFNPYRCEGLCSGTNGAQAANRGPLVPLAEGPYAVVAVWADSFCPNGRIDVSAFDGESFTLTVAGKCLPSDLKLRAVFAPSGGAFFGYGEAPGEQDIFHIRGVVDDPDAFTGVLTRTTDRDDKELELVRLTGRRMTNLK